MPKEIHIKEDAKIAIKGRVSLSTCPASTPEADVLKMAIEKFQDKNLVVSSANTVLAKLMERDFAAYMPFFITVGAGGDLEQIAKVDSGARVAPALDDTEIRSVVAKLPIVQVTGVDGASPSPSPATSGASWVYVAIARPHEALTTSLNELGVETINGTLFSHYVTPVGDDGRALKYVKSGLEYLVIRWQFNLELVT